MKTSLKAILIALFFLYQSIFSQDYDPAEIYIYNNSTEVLYVRLYPISSVFDKPYPSSTPKFKLFTSLNPGLNLYGNPRPNEPTGPRIIYLVGLDGYALTHNQDRPGWYKLMPGYHLFVDIIDGCGSCEALIGHGIYSLEFYENQDPFMGLLGSPIIIDYSDLNYRYAAGLGGYSDVSLFITYVNYQTAELRANFQWSTIAEDELPIGDVIDLYNQYGLTPKKWTHS